MRANTLSASSLTGNDVKNHKGENIGSIKEIMINLQDGSVAYAVLSFGGFLGMGDKLFAIPWSSIIVDQDNKCCVISMSKEQLENAPGFDKDNWPKAGDTRYLTKVYDYHNVTPFWTETVY
jgi:sporulation protein YlmC with PRC-barrel domain